MDHDGFDDRFFQRGLKLSHLRLLVLFATLGQVRLVAQRLHVSQPAVSKQIAELEAGVGAPVLQRVGNRLQFTAVGEALLRRAREVLLQLEQARHDVHALSRGISGSIAVGVVTTVLPVVGPEFTMRLKRRAPSVELRFQQGTSDVLYPLLAAGELDLVFSRMPPPAQAAGLVGQALFEDPMVPVCGRDNPLAARRSLTVEDLRGMTWILPPPRSPTLAVLHAWLQAHGLDVPAGCVESTVLAFNQQLMQRYPFLALMPRSLAEQAAHEGALCVLSLPGASFLPKVWLFRNASSANPVVGIALECAQALQPGVRALP